MLVLNPELIAALDENNMQDDLPIRNCNFFIDWTVNQTSFGSDCSNIGSKQSMFKNNEMLFIYLNVNRLLPKKEEMQHLVELTHASIVGISRTKFDGPN